jgi:hypothetical protein
MARPQKQQPGARHAWNCLNTLGIGMCFQLSVVCASTHSL